MRFLRYYLEGLSKSHPRLLLFFECVIIRLGLFFFSPVPLFPLPAHTALIFDHSVFASFNSHNFLLPFMDTFYYRSSLFPRERDKKGLLYDIHEQPSSYFY